MTRAFDIFFSCLALVVLMPLLVTTALILKFTGEGEVFFVQERVGKNKKMFGLLKFATMLKDSPNIGTGTVTVKHDPRVLPVGRVLRKTKINELPQLANVLVGHMSLIGPRPQASRCFEAFPPSAQRTIIEVKPGLSGIGPIVFRSEEDILDGHAGTLDFYDNVVGPYKGSVEGWYVKHQSLALYLLLIVLTIWVVVMPTSSMVWRLFKDLPAPPAELQDELNYPY